MNKQEVVVPRGVRYLGDWGDFKFSNFPLKCILDKKIPGCGFTEYCLTGSENVILCSPRKILLENKKESHGDSVYLVRNELETTLNYDKNLMNGPDKSAVTLVVKNPTKEETRKVYERLYNEIQAYSSQRFNQGNLPCKILVTYDSFHIVKDILECMGVFQSFYVIVDEFQTILHDAKFKSDTELKFLDYLGESHSSVFVSATPMMEEYLDILDEFNGLPYYVLDWITEDPSRLIKPDLKPLTMKSVGTKCEEITNRYKSGNFEKINMVKEDGTIQEVVSTEAVFYVNSVNHIINVINKCDLGPDEVNILCSDTDYNRKRLKIRLKGRHQIGKVPMKGKPNKMFTFCTRTVYLGADFYSKCARSFIFSDANINTLVVDISEDLAQIMGRQRDEENPWRNSATFYYIPSNRYNPEEFEKNLITKTEATSNLLNIYEKGTEEEKRDLSKKYEEGAKAFNYRSDYVAVNTGGIPVLNRLAMIAEKRSYEIQKYDYADRFAIFNKLENTFGEGSIQRDTELEELYEEYGKCTTIPTKLKLLCSISPDLMYRFVNRFLPNSDNIKFIMLTLPQNRVIALGYDTSKINKEISVREGFKKIGDDIMLNFRVGDHYSNTYISKKLQAIYDKNGIKITAKATDIKRWFEVKDLKLQDKKENKRVHGLKLIRLL